MRTQIRRSRRNRRDIFAYDLWSLVDRDYDHDEVEDRIYLRELTGKFKENDNEQ